MKRLVLIVGLIVLCYTSPNLALGQTVTVFPDSFFLFNLNCVPFGIGGMVGPPTEAWAPFAGFIYRNVPPFSLAAGDTIAFDLAAVNDFDVQLQIEMAPATSNGGTDPELPFVTLVSNTQTPLNPKGDEIVGNFEMQFTAEAPFNFPGGGLIIRFSNPSAAYQADIICTDVMVNGVNSDLSDFFEIRFFNDADGLPPYPAFSGGFIGAFQVIGTGEPFVPSIPTLNQWGMITMAAVLGLFAVIGLFVMRRRNVVKPSN